MGKRARIAAIVKKKGHFGGSASAGLGRFAANQRGVMKRPGARKVGTLVAAGAGRRDCPGWDLSACPPPESSASGILITPQPVVDFLYSALGSLKAALDRLVPGRWYVHWGTHIGAMRVQSMLGYSVLIKKGCKKGYKRVVLIKKGCNHLNVHLFIHSFIHVRERERERERLGL